MGRILEASEMLYNSVLRNSERLAKKKRKSPSRIS